MYTMNCINTMKPYMYIFFQSYDAAQNLVCILSNTYCFQKFLCEMNNYHGTYLLIPILIIIRPLSIIHLLSSWNIKLFKYMPAIAVDPFTEL